MELNELTEELDDLRPGDQEASDSLAIIMTKVGQAAEVALKLRSDDADQLPQDHVDETRRDLLAGMIVACLEYAAEHDVGVEDAIDERLDRMRDMREQHDAIKEAIESGDAKALAEALDADTNEVPTGLFEDEGDGSRGFQ